MTKEKQAKKNNETIQDKTIDSKSIRNIIGSVVLIVICVSMILTGHFAFKDMKNKDSLKIREVNDSSFSERMRPNGEPPTSAPNEETKDKNKEESETETNKEETDSTKEKTKKSKKEKSDNKEINENKFRENKIEARSGMNLFFVILFMIESFILGADIMFLIYANIK